MNADSAGRNIQVILAGRRDLNYNLHLARSGAGTDGRKKESAAMSGMTESFQHSHLGPIPLISPSGIPREVAYRRWLSILGLVLLAMCAWWWAASIKKNQLVKGQQTWVPLANFLGADFLSNYHAARHWLKGGDPYIENFGDPLGRPFVYSPVVLALFSWCRFLTPRTAVVVWMFAVTVMAGIGVIACVVHRKRLGLWRVPWLFMLAAVLCSTPIAFALERGNCDLLVLMLIFIATAGLGKTSFQYDLLAGLSLALGAWIKAYAGLLGIGLLALKRPRAALCMICAFVAMGVADYKGTLQHLSATKEYVSHYDIPFVASAHPLGVYWKHLWEGTGLARLALIPGSVGAALVLLPIVLWTSLHLYRRRKCANLYFPYFCWLAGVATFMAPVSNDYNLFFLPIAALAVWDRRDPLLVHLMMAPLLLWWQPMQLSIGPMLMLGIKLLGVCAIAMSLVARCREQTQAMMSQESEKAPIAASPAAAAA